MESELKELVEELQDQIEDLSEVIDPLLGTPLSESATRLPVVDRAKLYVLTTYAIESLLFSYLRLSNVKTKEHPIMRELARVKQYVQKIKDAESAAARKLSGLTGGAAIAAEGGMSIDKAAAGRFIKHALAGNEQYDKERAETQAREKARAHIKFLELSKNARPELEETSPNLEVADVGKDEADSILEVIDDDKGTNSENGQDGEEGGIGIDLQGQELVVESGGGDIEGEEGSSNAQKDREREKKAKKERKARKREKKERKEKKAEKRMLEEAADSGPEQESNLHGAAETEENQDGPPPKKRRRGKKKSRMVEEEWGDTIEVLADLPSKKWRKRK